MHIYAYGKDKLSEKLFVHNYLGYNHHEIDISDATNSMSLLIWHIILSQPISILFNVKTYIYISNDI